MEQRIVKTRGNEKTFIEPNNGILWYFTYSFDKTFIKWAGQLVHCFSSTSVELSESGGRFTIHLYLFSQSALWWIDLILITNEAGQTKNNAIRRNARKVKYDESLKIKSIKMVIIIKILIIFND